MTVAPETPSEGLQRRLNKEIRAGDLLHFAECAKGAGLKELKLYYLLGIEGETASDREAIVDEVRGVASRITVRVSVGPLIPKARTPLQWAEMQGENGLWKKYYALKKSIAKIPAVRMSGQSVKGALVEAALSRGDRKLTRHLVAGKLPRSIVERYALRRRGEHEPFPWEHIGSGVKREYLWAEYRKYMRGEPTSPCIPGGCFTCGVCR